MKGYANGRPADNQDHRGRCARTREVNILSVVSVGIGTYQFVSDEVLDDCIDAQRSAY